ncbi:hypothetical protein [Lysobacter gummosus]|uniref:hypothetical protein n=1 Tax=Lysobacter gummosus TaxID=262324 RepID=UPI0036439CC4
MQTPPYGADVGATPGPCRGVCAVRRLNQPSRYGHAKLGTAAVAEGSRRGSASAQRRRVRLAKAPPPGVL